MRFVVSSNRMRCLNQVAAIGLMAILGAGCSSDFARFNAEQYTASISGNQTPAADNPYPSDVDPVTTASVSGSGYKRPPTPTENVYGAYQATQTVQNRYSPTQIGANRAPAVQPPANYNTNNTYNTYQNGAAKKASTYRRPVSSQVNQVDRIVTSSIKPAVQAKQTRAVAKSVAKPIAKSVAKSIAKPVSAPIVTSAATKGWTSAGGTSITVRDGETLYNISKRYGVPVKSLMKVNNIGSANQVDAGQRIIIPTYIYSRELPVSAPDNNPKTRAARATRGMIGEVRQSNIFVPTRAPTSTLAAPVKQVVKTASSSASRSHYSVISGDTLGSIAQRNGVRVSDIVAANAMNSSALRVGQKLIIPKQSSYGQAAKTVTKAKTTKTVAKSIAVATDKIVTGTTPKPYVKPKVKSVSKAKGIAAKAPARTGIDTFRWPATGRVISKFGDRRRGERNDGIDISVPEGTSVKAAENGVVIYSGNELQDYGNLLLVRHDGGWVSAYAHNKSLNAKRGDKVSRGQIIAKSGRTGNAVRPMIHFELRKDANPVNPQKYLR